MKKIRFWHRSFKFDEIVVLQVDIMQSSVPACFNLYWKFQKDSSYQYKYIYKLHHLEFFQEEQFKNV